MLKLEAYICKIIREFTCWGHICANFIYVCVDPCIHNYVNVSYIMCTGYVWMGVLAEVSKVRLLPGNCDNISMMNGYFNLKILCQKQEYPRIY